MSVRLYDTATVAILCMKVLMRKRNTTSIALFIGCASVAASLCFTTILPLPEIVDWRGGAEASSTEFMNAAAYSTSKTRTADGTDGTDNGGSGYNAVLTYYPNTYPKPIPRDDQILVKVVASSVNPVDFKLRRNARFIPNFILPERKIPGGDLAGMIVHIGSSALKGRNKNSNDNLKIGDRVAAMMPLFGSQWGSNSDYVAIDASLLSKIPDNVDYQSAASLPLVSLTVIQSLNKLKFVTTSGKKILIHAGAGGVGTFAIQYAKHVLGMHVATTASAAKADLLHSLGADLVIDYQNQDFAQLVQDYDVVLDTMSFLYEEKSLRTLKNTGHYLNIFSSDWSLQDGKEVSIGPVTFWNWSWHKFVNFIMFPGGGKICNYDFCAVEPSNGELQLALDLVASGKIKPVIDKVYMLEDISNAHEYLSGGHVTGKVLIQHE